MLAILLLTCGAEPPQFQVENKVVPAFTVVNKIAPQSAPVPTADPYHFDYPKFHAYILAGHRGVLFVGVPDTLKGSYTIHSTVASGFGGLADGTYDCHLQNGSPVMVRREVGRTAVPFSQTPAVVVSGSTQITGAIIAVPTSTPLRGFYPAGSMSTGAVPAGWSGNTNCAPGVP